MGEFRNRAFVPLLVDLALLVAALKIGFMLSPGERPELAMLGAAAVVQLLLGPRAERFLGQALASGTVIFLLYAFYWSRARDAWPLAPWFLLLFGWRMLARRKGAFPERRGRIGRGLKSLIYTWVPLIGRRLWAGIRMLVGAWQWFVARPGMRYVRVLGLGLAGVGLMWPYLTRGIVGAGDAYWYTNTVADYVVQMRAGLFPPWMGQSDYSFYGGTFPVRFAPYLAHLAGAIDLLTGRQLPVYSIMNAALGVSLVAAMLGLYACLRAITPERPWTRMGLALCYGLCPGVLGLVYAQDLYMSFCTLPFLPVAFLGAYRSFTRNDGVARFLMVGGVAAAWLAHPPIGMWCGLVVGVTQVVRLFTQESWRSTWRLEAGALGWFVLLAGYPVISVRSLGPLSEANAAPESYMIFIKQAFPANWRPLSAVRALDNLQLGYGLAALALVVALFARGPAQRLTRVFLWCAGGLTVLVLPIPFLTINLWRAVPQAMLNITNLWPVQRLLVLTALSVIFGVAAWLAAFRGGQWAHRILQGFLLGALVWGGIEAGKFIRPALAEKDGWARTELLTRAENRVMTPAALGPQPVRPRYFSHGVTNVTLEHRFLRLDGRTILRNATDAILPGFGPGGEAKAGRLRDRFGGQLDANPGILNLQPSFTLEPGKHYLLALEFLEHDYTGVLMLDGHDFTRIYGLPAVEGSELSFGPRSGNAHWLALWQTTDRPEEVRLRWIPTGKGARAESYMPFANFELREYDPAALDVVLESLVPYRAVVKAPAASYLETPRVYIPGYRAEVDGRPVPVEKSPDGLVMVRLEPGRHVLELPYTAPLVVRLAYYAGLAGWLGFLVVGVRTFRREAAQRRAS